MLLERWKVHKLQMWWSLRRMCFRCVPALFMVFQMCPKSHNDVFTSPTRFSEPSVGCFWCEPFVFWV